MPPRKKSTTNGSPGIDPLDVVRTAAAETYKPPPPPEPEPGPLDHIINKEGIDPDLQSRLREVAKRLHTISLDQVYEGMGITVEEFFDHVVPYFSEEPALAEVTRWFFKLKPFNRERVTFNQIAEKSGLGRRRMFQLLSLYAYDHGQETAKRLIYANLPGLVEESLRKALNGDPESMREWMKAQGFWTVPKGAQTTINVNAQAVAAQSAQALGLPSFEETINVGAEEVRHHSEGQRALGDGGLDELTIDLPEFAREKVEARG